MDTTALRSHYSRVIVSKRQGKCYACGTLTASGRDYAAVNASGQWHAYCVACAASFAAQVAGLVKRAEAAAADASPEVLAGVTLPDEAAIVAVIQGNADTAAAYDAVIRLQAVIEAIQAGKGATHAPLAAALRAIADDSTASPGDRTFARSVADQAARRPLSAKQVAAGERLVARHSTVQAQGGNGTTVTEEGVYVNAAGVIVKVQRSRTSGKLYGKAFRDGAWEYAPRLAQDTTLRPLTADEAAAFGHHTGQCVFCLRELTDERSVVVGYGPVCAAKRGLPWGD